MMNFLRAFFCLSHDHLFRDRDGDGKLVLVCTCGHVQRVLTTQAVKGPAHEQATVLGEPKQSAVRADTVTHIKRQRA